jgi:hypothetical protein
MVLRRPSELARQELTSSVRNISDFRASTALLLPCFHSRKAGQNLNFCARRNGRNTTISGLNAFLPQKNLNARTGKDHHSHLSPVLDQGQHF